MLTANLQISLNHSHKMGTNPIKIQCKGNLLFLYSYATFSHNIFRSWFLQNAALWYTAQFFVFHFYFQFYNELGRSFFYSCFASHFLFMKRFVSFSHCLINDHDSANVQHSCVNLKQNSQTYWFRWWLFIWLLTELCNYCWNIVNYYETLANFVKKKKKMLNAHRQPNISNCYL